MNIQFFYSGRDLAGLFGIPASMVYRGLRDRKLTPFGRTQREVLFRKQDSLEYLKQLAPYLKAPQYAHAYLVAKTFSESHQAIELLIARGEMRPARLDDVTEF